MDFYNFTFLKNLYMHRFEKIFSISFSFLLAFFLFQSCKTDEFKFSEITMKKEWGVDVVSPLFSGDGMEFRDFIYDWKKPVPATPEPFTVLEYSNNSHRKIPTSLMFSPSAVIDSFPFYIQGQYNLSKVALFFKVSNGCPFPLNLEMQFFNKNNPAKLGPKINPASFKEANVSENPFVPYVTRDTVELSPSQLESFIRSDRVKFTSWYTSTGFILQHDTLSAHYPIDVSIVLIGLAQWKNEN